MLQPGKTVNDRIKPSRTSTLDFKAALSKPSAPPQSITHRRARKDGSVVIVQAMWREDVVAVEEQQVLNPNTCIWYSSYCRFHVLASLIPCTCLVDSLYCPFGSLYCLFDSASCLFDSLHCLLDPPNWILPLSSYAIRHPEPHCPAT